MDALYGILNLDADLVNNFAVQARLIEKNIENERILQRAARALKQINDKFQIGTDRPKISDNTIEEVLKKVEANYHRQTTWETKELRVLSYYLMRLLKKEEQFRYAVKVIDENWRNIFIGGLTFFLMGSWCHAKVELRELVSNCLRRHLAEYDGSIKKYLTFKEHSDFLETSGPTRLATLLITKNQPATKAAELMGLKPASFAQSYFSDVIISYIKRRPNIELDDLKEIFVTHNYDRTKKLVFANLIIKAEELANGLRQEMIAKAANSILGDISLSSTWVTFAGATAEEIQMLDYAHNLVVTWYARKSVETFFEVCVQDPRRCKFWLNYVNYINDFRIVGSQITRRLLQNDGRVSTMLKSCFIETNSRLSTTAALVLFIGEKVFVEFSDVGSVYIYNSNRPIVKNIRRIRTLDDTKDLKMPKIGKAVEQYSDGWYGMKSYSFSPEGSLTHQGVWETRLKSWFDHEMDLTSEKNRRFVTPKQLRAEEKKPAVKPVTPPQSQSTRSGSRKKVTSPSLFPDIDRCEKTLAPGTKVNGPVYGIQSKLVFQNSCKLIANEQGLYLILTNKDRTYYLCPLQRKNFMGFGIWMARTGFENSFNVVLAKGDTRESLGTLIKVANDITFKVNGGRNVNIHAS